MTEPGDARGVTPEAPRVVGLIGGMGSGKSEVATAFARRGAAVVSGDRAGHEALRQPAIKEQVVRRWGRELLDEKGDINRRQLAGIVFHNAAERKALEAIVFPSIEQRLREQIEAAKRDPNVPLVILDAAILLEAGWNNVCDKLVYVDAPRPLRLQRLAHDRGWTDKEVLDREQAQMPLIEKRARADAILENAGSLEELNKRVDELLRLWGIQEKAQRTNVKESRTSEDPRLQKSSDGINP